MFIELSKMELEFIDSAIYVALSSRNISYGEGVKQLINRIKDASKEQENTISRVEVVDDNGRSYTNWGCNSVKISMQDDNRTMKVFINR